MIENYLISLGWNAALNTKQEGTGVVAFNKTGLPDVTLYFDAYRLSVILISEPEPVLFQTVAAFKEYLTLCQ